MAKTFKSAPEEEKEYFLNFRTGGFYKDKWEFNFFDFFTETVGQKDFELEKWTAQGKYNGEGTLWRYLEYGPDGKILGGSIKQGKPYEKYGLWSPQEESLDQSIFTQNKNNNNNSYAWKTSMWDQNDTEKSILVKLLKDFKIIVDWARLGWKKNEENNKTGFEQISEYACDKKKRKFSPNVVWKIAYMFSSNGIDGDGLAPGILPIYGSAAWNFFKEAYGLDVKDGDVDKNRHEAQKSLMEKLDYIKGNGWRNGDDFFKTYVELWNQYDDHTAYDLLVANKNLILTGAPGTGKTYMAKQLAEILGVKSDSEQFKFVQFHPSYDYTDFVEGLRPVKKTNGGNSVIEFERRDGVFKEFCKKALLNPNEKYVFVIDEINRGEMSKIFGELFFSIDPGYRGTKGRVQTQYQNLVDFERDKNGVIIKDSSDKEFVDVFKDGFYVPENVYIIGTMNDIDRSVDSMDFAMRRRFAWKEVTAEESANNMGLPPESKQRMSSLNEAIENVEGLDSSYHIGGSYFLNLDKCGNGKDRYSKLWDFYISGVVKEYLRGMSDAKEQLEKIKKAYDFLIPMALLERIDNLNLALKDAGVDLKISVLKDFKDIFVDGKSKSMSLTTGYQVDADIEGKKDVLWSKIEQKIKTKVGEDVAKYKNVFIENEHSCEEESE